MTWYFLYTIICLTRLQSLNKIFTISVNYHSVIGSIITTELSRLIPESKFILTSNYIYFV